MINDSTRPTSRDRVKSTTRAQQEHTKTSAQCSRWRTCWVIRNGWDRLEGLIQPPRCGRVGKRYRWLGLKPRGLRDSGDTGNHKVGDMDSSSMYVGHFVCGSNLVIDFRPNVQLVSEAGLHRERLLDLCRQRVMTGPMFV